MDYWSSTARISRRGAFAAALLSSCARKPQPGILSTIPPFILTDQSGREFRSEKLFGVPWVASFFFANCTSHCPRLNTALFQLQERTNRIHIVSFTVDPANDSPAVLAQLARRYKADATRWHLLTGSPVALGKISESFFAGKLGMEHTMHYLLVDADMRFRVRHRLEDGPEPLLKDIENIYGTA
jgi:protein SCO1/2